MPRSQIASDNFNYSDGDLQTVSGAVWTQLNPSAATLDVTGGAVTCIYSGLGACRWTGAGTWTADQYAKATITGPAAFARQGVIVRASAATDFARSFYYAYVDAGSATVVGKYVDGTSSELSNVSGDGWVTGNTIELEAQGATLRVFRNGALLRSVSDTSLPGSSSDRPGIIMSADSARLDDWEGGSVTSATRFHEITLVDEAGAPLANLTGLQVYGWDTNAPASFATTPPPSITP